MSSPAVIPRLSPEDRNKLYKPGSIRRVKLHNFLTYADVECEPGPRLNVVIGPNGTGKSTILCAICLGLGGQPTLLGRADDARTFIMHDKEEAIIEIELAPFPNKPTHIIRRTIDRNKGATGKRSRGIAASTYHINDQQVRIDDVRKLVSDTYHIAIDNLCTFLPQDKVGSFSGFDSKMLLEETEKSVSGTQHLYNDHQRLIQLEKDMKKGESDLMTKKAELQKLDDEVKRLEREKELMEEREEGMKKIQLYKQKLMWVVFDEKRVQAVEKKAEKKKVKEELAKAQKDLAPLQAEIAELEHEYEGGKQRRVQLQKDIDRSLKNHHTALSAVDGHQDEIDTLQNQLAYIDSEKRQAEAKLQSRRRDVEEKEAMLAEYPSEEEINEKVKNAQTDIREAKRQLNTSKREYQRIMAEVNEEKSEQQKLLGRFNRMKDDKAMRNEKILAGNKALRETFEWVNANRKEFRRPVHGPIVCEITTRDVDASNYLEQHVRNSILTSFVVECKEDSKLLYREVREKRGMRINIQVVEQGREEPVRRMYSDHKMNVLRQEHDVKGYLDEYFEAPPAIMQALRNTSNVQSVLIGGQRTKNNLDNQGLQEYLFEKENGNGKQSFCIFAKERNRMYKYTSTISRYDPSKTSVSTDEVSRARMLSPGVSPEEKNRCEDALRRSEEKLRRLEPSIESASQDHDRVQKEAQQLQSAFQDAKRGKKEYMDLQERVRMARNKLKQFEKTASKDTKSDKKKLVKQIKTRVNALMSELEKASSNFNNYLRALNAQTGLKLSEDGQIEKRRRLEEQLHEIQSQTQNLQRQYQIVEREFNSLRNTVVELKKQAEQQAPITDAKGNDTPLREQLDALPAEKVELEDLIEDTVDKVKRIMHNPGVIRNYDEQKAAFDALKQELDDLQGSKGVKKRELESLKAPYVASLENIVRQVNELFTTYMSELGCAGEVALSRAESEGTGEDRMDNFEDWGVEIRVKFRESSNLQVLDARVHSGGERSVSTIMYLMAMQDLMVSPFRCVDEINQGLDERNERLVFRRIVQNSTREPEDANDLSSHCGQYFLITPKLLPNLTDMETEGVTVLCIFNGPYNFDHYSDWNVDKLLEMRKHYIEDDDSVASPGKRQRIDKD